MKRREFIVGFGALVVVSARLASAQQSDRPLIGILSLGTSTYDLEHYREGLKEAGYVEGQNLAIEYRFANDDPSRLSELASDLVRSRVRVIVAGGTNSVLAAKAATMTIPIVFLTGGDPVNLGLVSSLNRPTGNITGLAVITNTLEPKQLQLLHEVVPTAKLVGFLATQRTRALSPISEWCNLLRAPRVSKFLWSMPATTVSSTQHSQFLRNSTSMRCSSWPIRFLIADLIKSSRSQPATPCRRCTHGANFRRLRA